MWARVPYIIYTFSKMKCNVFSAQLVEIVFSSDREFYLVFKYVYVYICFLTGKLTNFPLSAAIFLFFSTLLQFLVTCLLCLKI